MKTSYFANVKNLYGENLVSIALKTPDGFRGITYERLAPKYDWWIEWRDNDLSEEWYRQKYYETVLDKLNPGDVYKKLGDDAILCCWEGFGKFCHRHIVADWLKSAGYEVEEL